MRRIIWGLFITMLALTPASCFGLVYKVEPNLAYTDLGAGDLTPGTEVFLYRPGEATYYSTATIGEVTASYATFAAAQVKVGDRVRTTVADPGELIFVYLADTHFGLAKGTQNSLAIIEELKGSSLAPAFALIGGDITDRGQSHQFAQSRALLSLPFPVYPVPGNHDLRWAEGGKELYRKWWRQPYYSFTQGPYKFLALDSSIRMEQYGHIETQQLEWLEKELQGDEEKIVFLHHPIIRGSNLGQKMVDNQAQVLELLSRSQTRLLLSSHLHNFQFWQAGGISSAVSPGALNGEYLVVNLNRDRTTIYTKRVGQELVLEKSYLNPQKAELKVITPAPGEKWEGAIPVEVVLPQDSRGNLTIAVDGNRELTMALEAKGDQIPWQTTLSGNWTVGWHTLSLRYQEESGAHLEEQRSFFYQPPAPSPSLRWETRAGGDLQAGPALTPDSLLVTTLNGWVECFAREDGKLLWKRQLGSPLPGGAAWGKNAFYLGSEAGGFYSFTAAGALRWSLVLEGSVLTKPVLADNLVLAGAGQNLVAIESQTGTVRWQKNLGGLIEAPPLVIGNTVYITSWEGSVLALRLADGEPLWQRKLDLGIYAPGGASPAMANGILVVPTPRKIWGLEPKNGGVLWQLEEKLLYAPLGTKVGNLQVAGTLNRQLIGITPGGIKAWEKSTEDIFTGTSPVGGGKEAYQVALGGTLYRLWDEAGLNSQPLLRVGDGFILGDPFFDGTHIYFTSLDGKIAVWNLFSEGR